MMTPSYRLFCRAFCDAGKCPLWSIYLLFVAEKKLCNKKQEVILK